MLSKIMEQCLTAAFGALAMVLVRHQAKRSASPDPFSGEKVLRYGGWIRALGWTWLWLAIVLLVGHSLIAQPQISARGYVAIIGLELWFVALSFYFTVETTFFSIVLDDRSITDHSPWRRSRSLEWNEVVDVSYSPSMQCFVVKGKQVNRKENIDQGAATVRAWEHDDRAGGAAWPGARL